MTAVAIPPRLSRRPRHGHLPVPYITGLQPDGTPMYATNDENRRQEVLRRRWCGMCGEELSEWLVFVATPESVRTRLFLEPAQHEECARYVLAVCPFFANPRYRVGEEMPRGIGPRHVVVDSTRMAPGPRQVDVGLYVTSAYQVVPGPDGFPWAEAAPPRRVRWVLRAGN